MATPIQAAYTSAILTERTSHVCPMPTGIEWGDLLVLQFYHDTNPGGAIATPSGWTLLNSSSVADTNYAAYSIFWKRADGTESGTNVTITTVSATESGYIVQRIKDASNPTSAGAGANNFSSTMFNTVTVSANNIFFCSYGVHRGWANVAEWDSNFTHFREHLAHIDIVAEPGYDGNPGWGFACSVEVNDVDSTHSEGYATLNGSRYWKAQNYYCTYRPNPIPLGIEIPTEAAQTTVETTDPPVSTTPVGIVINTDVNMSAATVRADTAPRGIVIDTQAAGTSVVATAVTSPASISVEPVAGLTPIVTRADTVPSGIAVDVTLSNTTVVTRADVSPVGCEIEVLAGKSTVGATASFSPTSIDVSAEVGKSTAAGSSDFTPAHLCVVVEAGRPAVGAFSSFSPLSIVIDTAAQTSSAQGVAQTSPASINIQPEVDPGGTTGTVSVVPASISIEPTTGQPSVQGIASVSPVGIAIDTLAGSSEFSGTSSFSATGITVDITADTSTAEAYNINSEYILEVGPASTVYTDNYVDAIVSPQGDDGSCGCCEECVPPTLECDYEYGVAIDYTITGANTAYIIQSGEFETRIDITLDANGNASSSIPLSDPPQYNYCIYVRNDCGEEQCCPGCDRVLCGGTLEYIYDAYHEPIGIRFNWHAFALFSGLYDPNYITHITLNGVVVHGPTTLPGETVNGTADYYFGSDFPDSIILIAYAQCGPPSICRFDARCCWKLTEALVTLEDLTDPTGRTCTGVEPTKDALGETFTLTTIASKQVTGLPGLNGTWVVPLIHHGGGSEPGTGLLCNLPPGILTGIRGKLIDEFEQNLDREGFKVYQFRLINGVKHVYYCDAPAQLSRTKTEYEGEFYLSFGGSTRILLIIDKVTQWRSPAFKGSASRPGDGTCVQDCNPIPLNPGDDIGLGVIDDTGMCKLDVTDRFPHLIGPENAAEIASTALAPEIYAYTGCGGPRQQWGYVMPDLTRLCYPVPPGNCNGVILFAGTPGASCSCDNPVTPPWLPAGPPQYTTCEYSYFRVTIDYE